MTAELKDDAAIPPEINKYLAILSKDPGSMVFAPLAEAYRKAGMLDEAIATAQDGMKLRPDYVSGMVALGRAYFEKGLLAEARENLEKVLVIAPDNIIAASILEEIKKQGSVVRGQGPEKPEPVTSNLEPDKPVSQESEIGSQKIDEPEIEELTELEEFSELGEAEAEEKSGDFLVEEISFEAPEPGLGLAKEVKDIGAEKTAEDIGIWVEETESQLKEEGPEVVEQAEVKVEVKEKEARPRKEITTETIADLYIKQGYFEKAIDIYQTLYDADPENDEIKRKLDELKMQGSGVSTLRGIKGQGSEVEVEVEVEVREEETGVGRIEATDQGAELKTDENMDRLESWLKTIQSERRKD